MSRARFAVDWREQFHLSLDPEARIVLNHRFDGTFLANAARGGLAAVGFRRADEPADAPSTMEWGFRDAIRRNGGKVPDLVWDEGGPGKEAMVRVVARDPADLVRKLRLLHGKSFPGRPTRHITFALPRKGFGLRVSESLPAMTPIPTWNAQGVIPPYDLQNPTGTDRSPYRVSLRDFVLHFGTSVRRLEILEGLLRFRQRIHELGIQTGFQWVDGSFVENVESALGTTPNDVDVVTFSHLDDPIETALLAHTALVDPVEAKNQFKVDAYWTNLRSIPEHLVRTSSYWYSVWAHSRRGNLWKGFLELDLQPLEDTEALQLLVSLRAPQVTA